MTAVKDMLLPWRRRRTGRKGAGEPSGSSEERFRALAGDTYGGVAVFDRGRVSEANQAFSHMFGYGPSEVTGKSLSYFLDSRAREPAGREVYEAIGLKRNGTTFDVEVWEKEATYRDHIIRGVVVLDISERKRAEEIRQQRDLYEGMLDAQSELGEGLIILDDQSIRYANEAFCEISGYGLEELTALPSFMELLAREDRARIFERWRLGSHEGETRYDIVLRHKDGRQVDIEAAFRRIEEDGRPKAVGIVRDITERKRIEKELRETEQRHRTLIERIPAVTYIQEIDDMDRTTYISPQVETMLGYKPEECISDAEYWLKIMHPADREQVLAKRARAKELGEPFRAEFREFAEDGRVVWVRDEATLVCDEEGNPSYWLGVQYDITGRKRAEEALKESELRLRAVTTNLPVVLFALDYAGMFNLLEGKGLDVLGLSPGEVVGHSISEVYGDHPEILEDVDRVLAGEEFRTVREIGSRMFEIWYSPLRASTGEFCGAIGIAADVTDREQAEQALRESEKRFRSLVQNTSDIITVVEADGTVRYVSPAIEWVLGYLPEERLGRSVFELVHPDDVARAKAKFAESLRSPGGTLSTEVRVRCRDGSLRYMEATGTNLLDDPSVNGVVINSRNATERKQAEEIRARLARQAELRADVSAALAEGGALDDVLQRCTEVVVGRLDAAFARIWTLNKEENVLELQASAGMDTHLGGAHSRIPVGEYDVGRIAKQRQPHLTNDVINDPQLSDKEWAKREGMVAFAGHPLIVEDRLVGLMAMFAREPLAEDTIEVLAIMADLIAQGIEREQAEEALRRSEGSLAEAQRIAHIGNWEYEVERDRARWSDEMYRIFGLSRGNFVPTYKAFFGLLHPDDKEFIRRSVREALRSAKRRSIEYRIVRPDGAVRSVHTEYEVLRGESDKPKRLIGTVHDITERKWAEEEIRKASTRLATLIESLHAGILVEDESRCIVHINQEFCEKFGIPAPPQAMLGTDFSKGAEDTKHLFAESEEYVRRIDEILEEREPVIGEELLLADGRVFERDYVPIFMSEDYRGHLWQYRDITERKKAEEEMVEANRRLEELAALKADFTAMVAHELDTPLAVIRGYTDMLATGELGPAEQSRALDKVHSEIDVLEALVSDVRAAAVIEREAFTINPRSVTAGALLQEATAFAETLPGDHPLVVENTTDGQEMWADPYRIGQVLRNLLSNAAKYSPKEAPIKLRAVPGGIPGRVRIEVEDLGVGIHPDDATRIFEKFGRGRDRSGRKVAGVGLGLYLSRRILQAHGSDLTLASAPGEGSVFGFELEAVR